MVKEAISRKSAVKHLIPYEFLITVLHEDF
jgi:hypothetical protein